MKSVKGKLPKGGGKGLSGDALVGKVSQSTIDDIKRMGMTKALALAGKNGKTSGGMAREFQEGVRRMYGAKRLESAKAKYSPVKSKSADAARGAMTKPAPKPAAKPVAKGSSAATKAKVVGGTVLAIGLAAKGGPAGRKAAAKLAPALTKSAVGKALFGTGEKLTTKGLSGFGRVNAKVTKSVSQSQFDAMKATAKAKGIKTPTADAAKAAASKPKPKVAKAGAATLGAGQTKKTTKK